MRGFAIQLMSGVCAAGLLASFAQAQEAAPEAAQVEEVVVTGTLIRGVAPVGSQVLSVGTEDIQRQGIVQPNQLLASIPQMGGFSSIPRTSTAVQGVSGYRPNLRGLPPLQNGTTLILVDSHQVVGSSVQQNFTDISALPTGAIERVEVVLDGGSATYGSDAIGGVLNFITRSHYDGLQISGTAGGVQRSDYRAYTLDLLAGRDWEGGGAVIALSHRENNNLEASDRDFPRQDLTPWGGSDFRVRTCDQANIIIGANTYALPGRAPGTLNQCDTARLGVINSRERQDGGYLSVSQTLADNLEFQLKGYATVRETWTDGAPLTEAGAVINATNPFFQRIGTETQQTVAFNWAPVLGARATSSLKLRLFDLSPSITYKLPGDWQFKAVGDYSRSYIDQRAPLINTAAEAAALRGAGLTTATALNPYNLTATNPAVLNAITNYENYNRARQNMVSIRGIFDGPVFSLPAGDVRVAVGGQSQRVANNNLNYTGVRNSTAGAVRSRKARHIHAVFGELNVPIVSPEMQFPLAQKIDLNMSMRYDNFQDIGETTNPKIGVNWTLIDGLKFRANWGTSFVAPGLLDTTPGATDATVAIAATTGTLRTGDPLSDRNRPNLAITGGTLGVQPVTAETWSAGVDYAPSFLDGLNISATYWSVEIDDLIQAGCPNSLLDQLNDPSLEGLCYYYKPSLATALAITAPYQIYQGAGNSVSALYGAGNDPYYIQDRRRKNYGGYNSTGVDFRVAYRYRTDWGAVYGSVNGTQYLSRESQALKTTPFVDQFNVNFSKINYQAVLGIDVENFTATATMNYSSGYTLTNVVNQTNLENFHPINLFFRYNFPNDLSATLNIDNFMDDYPPFLNTAAAGGISGSTLGRFWQVGLRKKF